MNEINVTFNITKVITDLAEVKAYQRRIYALLTRDLTDEEKKKHNLLRNKDFYGQISTLMKDYDLKNPELAKQIEDSLREVNEKLEELNNPGDPIDQANQE